MTKLTSKQQTMIDQVIASMAISDMPLDQKQVEDLKLIVSKEKTVDQLIQEIKARYLEETSSVSM